MEKKTFKIIPISRLGVITDTTNFAVPAIDGNSESGKIRAETLRGNQGYTPEIGNNGNWWINGQDTGFPARGEQGIPGNTASDQTICNVSQLNNNYTYLDKQSARNDVPADKRAKGQVIHYQLVTGKWEMEVYTGTDLNGWSEDNNWKKIGAEISQEKGNDTDKVPSLKLLSRELAEKADGCRLNDENKLQLTSEGKDVGMPIELPSGIVNISKDNKEYPSDSDAREDVKISDRYTGQVITYKLTTGQWILDMFVGESIGSWDNANNWTSYLTSADLTSFITDIEAIKNNITIIDNRTHNIPDDFEIDEDNKLYLTSNGERINDGLELPAGGTGGGSGTGIILRVRIVGASSMTIGENVDALIKYNFSSLESDTGNDTGEGTYVVSVNGSNVISGIASQGDNTFNLKDYVFLGSNTVKIKVTDSYGNARSVTWNIQVATLTLSSTFADDIIYNTNPVSFRYTVIGLGKKTVRFFLDGAELPSDKTDASGKQFTKMLSGLSNGSHSLKVFAESSIEGSALRSNELYYEFIYADSKATKSIIAVSYDGQNHIPQFTTVSIPYIVYNPTSPTGNVTIRVNGQVVSNLSVPRTKQIFTYQANLSGELKIDFTIGSISRTLNLTVVDSELNIVEEIADLEYKAVAIGKSNASEERDNWNNNGHEASFENFSWADDGWQIDDAGNNCLKLIADTKVNIDIKPFANDVLITGTTLTVEYSTKEVTDANAVLMSSMYQGIGIQFTANSVTLSSAQETLRAEFDSSSKISVSLVIQKLSENRLVYLLVDGIASGSLQYPNNDNFTQPIQQQFVISTGGRSCQLQVYGIRWYKNSLNFDQILSNYIYDIENLAEKMKVYARNQIIDAYGNIDYNKALQYLPCMTFIGELPNYKGDKKPTDIVYEDRHNPNNSFISTQAVNDVQGTSSQFYPRKNFKFKLKSGLVYTETGEQATKYSLRKEGIPSDVFCLKADFAESSGTHNTGIAVLINDMLKQYGILTPPQKTNDKVRTTIDGFPILLFHKENASSQSQFVGKYNFNYDKSAVDVFGFKAGNECWEFKNNTSKLCLFKGADFDNWADDLEARYPDGASDINNVQKLWEWVVSCIGNPDKFKSECNQHFDVSNLLFYYISTEVLVMTDQRAKNQMITTYGERGKTNELIWRFIFYDNDTALGINNEGRVAFNPYVEDQDTVESGYVWNGWDSELWRLVASAYPSEIKKMYQQLRQKQILSYATVTNILQDQQALKWSELVYNQDGKYKYIDPLVDGYIDFSSGQAQLVKTGAYLYALQGSRTRHRMWYLNERFAYMDSKYDAGSHINDTISMRLYTPSSWGGVAPDPNFKVTVAKDGYVRMLFGSVKTTGIRAVAGQNYAINAPAGVQLNDTETVLYGAASVKSLGDMSAKYIGTVDISKGYTLEDLIIGSTKAGYRNENLKNLHTGVNGRLKMINVANCPNLNQSLDLSKCFSIETIEARGSSITGCTLPASGVLKQAYLPDTFAALVLKNQPYLTTLSLQGYANLNTIVLENVPNIDGYELVKKCVQTPNSKLSKVRLINIDASDNSSTVLNALSLMTGEDENGQPTENAVVTGKIYINEISQIALDRFAITYPNLSISYSTLLNIIDFQDGNIKAIVVPKYDLNGDGEISENEISNASIPADLFTDSGAKSFNEGHYWKGNGSVINNCDTLEELSVNTGNYSYIENLPALKHLTIMQGAEDMPANAPLLNPNFLHNVYNVEKFTLSGRYVEGEMKGVILAKTSHTLLGQYYYWCLPLKGYENIVVKELLNFNDGQGNEMIYRHNDRLKNLTIKKLLYFYKRSTHNLETLNIDGFDDNVEASIVLENPIAVGMKFKTLNIRDNNNGAKGILKNIRITGDNSKKGDSTKHVLNIKIDDSVYSNDSSVNIDSNGGVNILDMGANFAPISLSIHNGNSRGSYSSQGLRTIIIRYRENIIPIGNVITPLSHLNAVYVPDELLGAYKVASNWIVIASIIYPLSSYNN